MGDHSEKGGTLPEPSPGKFSPVFSPMPNFLRYPSSTRPPILSEAMIAPMLLDFAMIPVRVRTSVPCASWSRNTLPPRSRVPGISKVALMLDAPSLITAARVMTLLVEPGS